jgi:hypothetical protein
MSVHDEAIELLSREVRNRMIAAEKNREQGKNLAEEKALQEAEHLRYAIRFFAKSRKATKKVDEVTEASL